MYSITYGTFNNERFISFCEFYKESINVKRFDELLNINYKGITVLQMWKILADNDVWIY